MPKQELAKKALNLRPGDFEKMGELFPDLGPTVAVRKLISAFVDKHYKDAPTTIPSTDIEI